jgi:hypothetical protein
MSSEAFKNLSREMLSPSDRAALDLCTLDPAPVQGNVEDKEFPSYTNLPPRSTSKFINAWREWERALRLNLARHRARQLKREEGELADVPTSPVDAGAVARVAVTLESPLEAELFLDQARWNAIEALQGSNYFGSNTVFAYLLKLFLMERHALFKVEEGFVEYKGLYTAIMAAAPTSIESGEPK